MHVLQQVICVFSFVALALAQSNSSMLNTTINNSSKVTSNFSYSIIVLFLLIFSIPIYNCSGAVIHDSNYQINRDYFSPLIKLNHTIAYSIIFDIDTSVKSDDFLMIFDGDPANGLLLFDGLYTVDVVVAAPQGITCKKNTSSSFNIFIFNQKNYFVISLV